MVADMHIPREEALSVQVLVGFAQMQHNVRLPQELSAGWLAVYSMSGSHSAC